MPTTNQATAEAATRQMRILNRPFMLIGIFDSPGGAHVLIRQETGAISSVSADTTTDGLRLHSIGDGWAMIEDGETLHRLTL